MCLTEVGLKRGWCHGESSYYKTRMAKNKIKWRACQPAGSGRRGSLLGSAYSSDIKMILPALLSTWGGGGLEGGALSQTKTKFKKLLSNNFDVVWR